MNRYYVFADDMYDASAGMYSCQFKTNNKNEAIKQGEKLSKIWDIVSVWDVKGEKNIKKWNSYIN